MEMVDLLRSKNLKLPYSNNGIGIKKLLTEKFEILIKELKQFSNENSSISIETINEIEKITKGLLDVIDKYLSGNITEAGVDFTKVMEKCLQSIYAVSEYHDKYISKYYGSAVRTYYKARCRSEKKKEEFKKKEELFHIPFAKRHLVGNQRYSVSGFPCMYLGATPYTCYEELGRPNAEDMYLIKVELPKSYKLLTIGLLPYELKDYLYKNEKTGEENIIENYLKMLPVIMACSVKVDEEKAEKAIFKEEYIIPQLITQWLITSDRYFDGILYFSIKTGTYSSIVYR